MVGDADPAADATVEGAPGTSTVRCFQVSQERPANVPIAVVIMSASQNPNRFFQAPATFTLRRVYTVRAARNKEAA